MAKRTKLIIFIISSIIFTTTIAVLLWISFRHTDHIDIHKHISYASWVLDESKTHQAYSEFKIDDASGNILATSVKKGTYVIDGTPSIVNQLTSISTDGKFSNTLLTSLSSSNSKPLDITFGSIGIEDAKKNFSLLITISIVSIGSMMSALYMLKSLIKGKKTTK